MPLGPAQTRLTLGIDEAGRGPAIGPLVLCGVFATPQQIDRLVALKIADSKTFGSGEHARHKREALAAAIRQIVTRVSLRVATAEEVDVWVGRGELNALENELARDIIATGPATDFAIFDGAHLFGALADQIENGRAENRADGRYPIVSAASIIAKHERDTLLQALFEPYQSEFAPIRGGGYCNAGTAAFVHAYFRRYQRLPEGTRRSWSWSPLIELVKGAP